MRKFVLATSLIIAGAAHASTGTVEITSFNYAAAKGRAAEICGKVTGVSSFPVFVKVVVDPKSKQPGNYSVVALEEKFCTTVVTMTGTADATVVEK